MNQFQEAIARITGVDRVVSELSEALEHVDSQNALLQRQIEDIDYLNLFELGPISDVIPIKDRKKTLNRLRRLRHENPLAKQSVQLIKRFTLGKGVELLISAKKPNDDEEPEEVNEPKDSDDEEPSTGALPKLRGSAYEDDSPDDLKKIVMSFWKDEDNKIALTSRAGMQEWLDNVITDGEKFFVCYEFNFEPYIKLTEIPLEEISNIVYNPDNWKQPIYYCRTYQPLIYDGEARIYKPEGQPIEKYYLDYRVTEKELALISGKIKIPASKLAPKDQRIYHSLINPLWTKSGKRGISELYASREWFRVYKEFMEDRAAINAAATSIAYKRKIKGGPTEVARFGNKLGNLNVGYDAPDNTTEIKKLTRPASAAIYDSNPAVDLEWMKTDTGAVNAKEDGRAILTSAGAGTGIFVHYYGEGGDANLATAQAMELPMVKTFEDWQQWVQDTLRDLCSYVIRIATDAENAKEQIERIAGVFPPIVSQDVVKYMAAWGQLVGTIAKDNQIVQREAIKGALTVMNVPNIDSLMVEIEDEMLRVEKEKQRLAAQNPLGVPAPNGKNGEKPFRNGDSNALDPELVKIASGKPPTERKGPKEL